MDRQKRNKEIIHIQNIINSLTWEDWFVSNTGVCVFLPNSNIGYVICYYELKKIIAKRMGYFPSAPILTRALRPYKWKKYYVIFQKPLDK